MPLALKYAFRRLAKLPQFTVLSVVMLGLGIALSTARSERGQAGMALS
jgi:hypothetical protein